MKNKRISTGINRNTFHISQYGKCPYFSYFSSRCFGLVVCLSLLSACALQYVDEHGARHIWGLAHTVVKETREARSEVVAQQVSAIGISILRLPEYAGFSVGYTRNFSIHISSAIEGGEISFSPDDPTDFQYQNLMTLMGGWKNVQTEPKDVNK